MDTSSSSPSLSRSPILPEPRIWPVHGDQNCRILVDRPHPVKNMAFVRGTKDEYRVTSRIIGVVFKDFGLHSSKGSLNLRDGDLISVPFLLGVERKSITTSFDKSPKTF